MIAAPFFVEYADSWWLTADPGSQGPALVWAFRWAFISIKFPWIGPFAGSSSMFSFFFLIWGLVTGQKVGQMRSWGAGIALPFKADNLWGRALRNSLITGDLRGVILTATVGTFTTHTHRWTVQSMGFPGLWIWRGKLKIAIMKSDSRNQKENRQKFHIHSQTTCTYPTAINFISSEKSQLFHASGPMTSRCICL